MAEINTFLDGTPEEGDIEDMFEKSAFLEMTRRAYLGDLEWPEEAQRALGQSGHRRVNEMIDQAAEHLGTLASAHEGAAALRRDRRSTKGKHSKTADRLRQAEFEIRDHMGSLNAFQKLFEHINAFFGSPST